MFGLAALASASGACGSDGGSVETSSHELVGDIASMRARGDGSFDVTCRDGVKELATAENITHGKVCVRPLAGTCSGTPLSPDVARAKFPSGTDDGSITLARYGMTARASRYESNRGTKYLGKGTHRWYDARTDNQGPIQEFRLTVRLESYDATEKDLVAEVPMSGEVILKLKAGVPYLQLVSDTTTLPGPDTTRLARIVSNEIEIEALGSGYLRILDYVVETGTAIEGATTTWTRPRNGFVEADYLVRYGDGSNAWMNHMVERFLNDQASIVTERCLAFVPVEGSERDAALSVRAAFGELP